MAICSRSRNIDGNDAMIWGNGIRTQDLYQSSSPHKCNAVSLELQNKPLENPYMWSCICDANIQKYQFSNLAAC